MPRDWIPRKEEGDWMPRCFPLAEGDWMPRCPLEERDWMSRCPLGEKDWVLHLFLHKPLLLHTTNFISMTVNQYPSVLVSHVVSMASNIPQPQTRLRLMRSGIPVQC